MQFCILILFPFTEVPFKFRLLFAIQTNIVVSINTKPNKSSGLLLWIHLVEWWYKANPHLPYAHITFGKCAWVKLDSGLNSLALAPIGFQGTLKQNQRFLNWRPGGPWDSPRAPWRNFWKFAEKDELVHGSVTCQNKMVINHFEFWYQSALLNCAPKQF